MDKQISSLVIQKMNLLLQMLSTRIVLTQCKTSERNMNQKLDTLINMNDVFGKIRCLAMLNCFTNF